MNKLSQTQYSFSRAHAPEVPRINFEKQRARPSIDPEGNLVVKQHISGLQEHEVEIGEEKYKIVNNISCEHNLRNIPSLQGTAIITNFKIIFKPNKQ